MLEVVCTTTKMMSTRSWQKLEYHDEFQYLCTSWDDFLQVKKDITICL